MPKSFGKRARTRDKYSKGFRKAGSVNITRKLITFRKGDMVDIRNDGSEQRGMAYSCYHGKTGQVFNVTKNSVGVSVKKVVGNRQIKKMIHVRVEHVRKSRCNEQFLRRVKENDKAHHEAHLKGESIKTKRQPEAPRDGYLIAAEEKVEVMEALPFVEDY